MENQRASPAITKFAEVARRYCDWAEGPALHAAADIHTARRLLIELHSAVIDLPDNCPETDTAEDAFVEFDWHAIRGRFQQLPVDGYWDVFNPLKEDAPVFNTLFDDLSDIWRDVKEGLVLYDRGDLAEAVWEWQFNFKIHWGAHLTGAQRAIHQHLTENS
ncbi:MAG: DUF5063 domain-containing protein [Pyrinomonadaceae bacterium]